MSASAGWPMNPRTLTELGEPSVMGNVAARPCGLDELRRELLHPSVDGDVIDGDAALGQRSTAP